MPQPVMSEIICARSRTRRVSATWLKISTGSPAAGGLFTAISMHCSANAVTAARPAERARENA